MHILKGGLAPADITGIPQNPMYRRLMHVMTEESDKQELRVLQEAYDQAILAVENARQDDPELNNLRNACGAAFSKLNRAIMELTERYPTAEPVESREDIDIKPKRMGSIPLVVANSTALGLRALLASARYGATPIMMQEKEITRMDYKLRRQAADLKNAHPIYREPCVLTPDHEVDDYWYYIQGYEDDIAIVVDGDRKRHTLDAEFLGIVGPNEIAKAKGISYTRIADIFKGAEKVRTAPEGIGPVQIDNLLTQVGQSFLPITKGNKVIGVTSQASAGYHMRHVPHENPRGGLAYLVALRNAWDRNLDVIRKWIEEKLVGIGFRLDRAHLDRGTRPYRFIKELRKLINELDPSLELIVGNLATGEAALRAVDAGATGLCVGIGPSPVCTTRDMTGHGVPQISATVGVREALDKHGDTYKDAILITDGGVLELPAHVAKVLDAGADFAMGSTDLVKTRESAPKIKNFEAKDKSRRRITVAGNASRNVQQEAKPRSDETVGQKYRRTQGPRREGVARLVPMNPEFENIREAFGYLMDGNSSNISFTGADSQSEARDNVVFMKQTAAGAKEGGHRSGDTRPEEQ